MTATRRLLGRPLPRFRESIEGDGEHNDDADDDLLNIRRNVHQHEAVEQDADQHGADDRAEDRADAAEEAGAADDDRGDHGQFIADAGDRLGRIQTRRQYEGAEACEETHDDIDAADHSAHVEAGEARRLGIAADRIDLPSIARVAQHDMGEDGEGDEDNDWRRHRSDLALTPPDIVRIKAADRSAAGKEQRRAAKDRHAAEGYDEGRHFESRYCLSLKPAAGDADKDRREGGQRPAVAERVLGRADREAVRDPALVYGGCNETGEGEQRADRQIDAGGEDHEGHANREKAVDRNLAHHVEEIERAQKPRLADGEARHQHDEENQRREARDESDEIGLRLGGGRDGSCFGHRFISANSISRPAASLAVMGSAYAAALPLNVIIAMSRSSVASRRLISPVTRPSRIVTIRSLIASTSGNSDEIAIMAIPFRAIS